MVKFEQLQRIKEIYAKGENIIQYLKSIGRNDKNTIEDILISYDFQAGSYIKEFSKNSEYLDNYCNALAKIIDGIPDMGSLMEVGVGEATTLNMLLSKLQHQPSDVLGFDISWSRVKFGQELLNDFNRSNTRLFTGNLFEIPLRDSSVDVVYTSHSIEPNGGSEEQALKELYRVAGKYLVLLEPSYELGNEDSRARMKSHGYITELHDTALRLGYKVIEHRLFEYCSNPLNPTGLMIIEKNAVEKNNSDLVCPITQTTLEKYNDCLMYSKDCFLAYPIIDGIPCLLRENSILATHLLTDYAKYKADNNIDFKSKI